MKATMSRSSLRHGLIAMLVLFVGSASAWYDDENGICPPYGTRMPPDEFQVAHSKSGRSFKMEELPVERVCFHDVETVVSLIIKKRRGIHPSDTIGVDWGWNWYIADGHVAMISGQIYRFDVKTMTFRRIPNHPLSHEPKNAIHLFAIPTDAGLWFHTLKSNKGTEPAVNLQVVRFDAEPQTTRSPVRAQLKMSVREGTIDMLVNPAEEAAQKRIKREPVPHELLAPVPSRSGSDLVLWVCAGQYIETTFFYLKVTRIVFPDPEQGIDGWVEVRVESDRPPSNRPPAPPLPED